VALGGDGCPFGKNTNACSSSILLVEFVLLVPHLHQFLHQEPFAKQLDGGFLWKYNSMLDIEPHPRPVERLTPNVAKYHLGKVKLELMQPASVPIQLTSFKQVKYELMQPAVSTFGST